MYRRNLRLTTFAKTFLILGIFTSCTLNQTTYTNEHLQALAKYENASASRDFMQETNKKESPFLAFNLRSKTEIPGLVEDDYQRALQHGFTIQKGMGDFIVNQKHKALREKFYIYASEYNRLLADYLFH